MSVYPPKVHQKCVGFDTDADLPAVNAVGRSVSFECGCFTSFSLIVKELTRTVERIQNRTNGCGYMVAAGKVLCENVRGIDLAHLHGLDPLTLEEAVMEGLGGLTAERRQCAQVAIEALRNAFADHRNRQLVEYSGEKALICTCFGVTEEVIEQYIAAASPASVDDVTRECRAGGGCGSCRMMIQELLDGHIG